MSVKDPNKSRRLRYGGIATAITVGVIAVIVVLNVLVTALNTRFPLSVDMTSDKRFTLSEQSKEYLKQVESDITIYLMMPKEDFESIGDPGSRVPPALEQFGQVNPKIKVEYIDLEKNPSFASQYPGDELTSTSIIIESDKRHYVISTSDLFDVQYDTTTYQQYVAGDVIEKTMITKIMSADVDEIPKVGIITGHNESTQKLENFKQTMTDSSYEVSEINLMTDEIPDDMAFLVIAEPGSDYTTGELRKIDEYLEKDVNNPTLVVTFGASYSGMTNLDEFLAEWGVKVGDGVIAETDSGRFYSGYPTLAIADYLTNELAPNINQYNGVTPIIMDSRPIETLFETQNGIEVHPVIQSAETAVQLLTDEEGNTTEGESGVFNAMTVSSKPRTEGENTYTSRVIAIGSTDYFNVGTVFNCLNDEIFTTMANKITGRDLEEVNISSRKLQDSSLQMTELQVTIVGLVIFVIALPLVVLIVGLVIWIRRRHL